MHRSFQAHAAFGEGVRGSLQLGDRPRVAVTEQALRAIGRRTRLGMDKIIAPSPSTKVGAE